MLHNGRTVSNNSIIAFEELAPGTALLCSTDTQYSCCQSNANWTSPSGENTTGIFGVSRGRSLLEVKRTQQVLQPEHSGVWQCEIPDRYNRVQHVYVGLYTQGKNTACKLRVCAFAHRDMYMTVLCT